MQDSVPLSFAESILSFSRNQRLEESTNTPPEDASTPPPENASTPPLSARPASPGAATGFASLPAEMRILVLAKLTSLIDLRHAIIASPDLHHAYRRNQKAVLIPVMKNAVRVLCRRGQWANHLWTRIWIALVVDFVIQGSMSFEVAMRCVKAKGLGQP